MLAKQPIGIFDSGIGGITIVNSIRLLLPNEDIIYIADQKYAPYGDKTRVQLLQRAKAITEFFIKHNCKAIVVACNTATVTTVAYIRSITDLPVIGVEPGIKPAVTNSITKVIGILATEQTLKSDVYKRLKQKYQTDVQIEQVACIHFVDLIEKLELDSGKTVAQVKEYLQPLLDKGADQIVLGCTHYAFLTPVIQQVIQSRAQIVDTASAVAAQLKRKLEDLDRLNLQDGNGQTRFYSSLCSKRLSSQISHLCAEQITAELF